MSPARHVVFDAPEASDGTSLVAAVADGDRCVLTITAGSGDGFTGHPLMFELSSLDDGCELTESTDVGSAEPAPGGGAGTGGSSGAAGTGGGGTSAAGGGGSGTGGSTNAGGRASGSGGTSASGGSGPATGGTDGGASGGTTSGGGAGAPSAGPTPPAEEDSGCGCRVGRGESTALTSWFALGVALLSHARRRRIRRRAQ